MAAAAVQEHVGRRPAREPRAPTAPAHAAPLAAALSPAAVLQLQRSAGNAALARLLSPRELQRCGASCGCATCSDELEQDEALGR